MKKLFTICIALIAFSSVHAQVTPCEKHNCTEEIALWNLIDGSKNTTRLYTYIPENFDSTNKRTPAVIICPGGSYHHLGMPHEGYQVGEWFAKQGITAFVLRYRVSSHGAHHPAMIQDLQATIAYIKMFADVYKIDTTKIGAIGFSAGGHLVAHGAICKENFIKKEFPNSTKYGLRPNFVMPIYPVVSMEDSIAHVRSRRNLLTRKYTVDDIHKFSIEQNIPDDMPPTFILACTDDYKVDIRNSRAFMAALNQKHIKNCMFTEVPVGGHGYGMFRTKSEQLQGWSDKILKNWLQTIGVLPQTSDQNSTK